MKSFSEVDLAGDDAVTVVVISAVVVTLLAIAVVAISAVFLRRLCLHKRREMQKQQEKDEQISRLKENWKSLQHKPGVGNLSCMPKEWKTSIVPIYSVEGEELHERLTHMAKKIEILSTPGIRCRSQRRSLETLKASFSNVMKDASAFFASRYQMYKSRLLIDANPGATVNPERVPSQFDDTIEWPDNTTPLFKQIMFLLRELDNMFKRSYDQRFEWRIPHEELAAWTDWVENKMPKLMPKEIVLTQFTSELFDLYRQAAEVHSYYNTVFKNLAKKTGAKWCASPLKKIFRILEKAQQGGPGDFKYSNIFDIVRGTLIYNTLSGLLRGVRETFASRQFQVARVKDRFTNPTSAHWRDVLINGRMISNNGTIRTHMVEVQFHHKALREERTNVGGHFIYERRRSMFEACEVACDEAASTTLEDLHIAKPMLMPVLRSSSAVTARELSLPRMSVLRSLSAATSRELSLPERPSTLTQRQPSVQVSTESETETKRNVPGNHVYPVPRGDRGRARVTVIVDTSN